MTAQETIDKLRVWADSNRKAAEHYSSWKPVVEMFDEAIRHIEEGVIAKAEASELEEIFELQSKRMGEATAAWREAHPGNDSVMPDLGDLLTWLLSERKKEGAAWVLKNR